MTTTPAASGTDDRHESFSARVRRETAPDHSSAEGGDAMVMLLKGELPLDAYLDLLVQFEELYRVLEDCSRRLRGDTRVGAFMDRALDRHESLVVDRRELERRTGRPAGPILAATATFTDRIAEVASREPLLFVAHHYTRYMGDLSGGIMIGRAVDKTFQFDGGPGASWFRFPSIPDVDAYKNAYRSRLDSLDLTAGEAAALIDEVHLSYSLNGDMLRAVTSSAR